MTTKTAFPLAIAGLVLAGCATPVPAPATEPVETSAAPAVEIEVEVETDSETEVEASRYDRENVFAKDDRPEQDYEMYAVRKSAEVLDFTGVGQGMTVVELEVGGGFYTELFSRAVGPEGWVYMQNPASFASFFGDSVSKRVDDRLDNVTVVESDFDALADIEDEEADLVTWFLGPHELWYTPEGEPEGALGDPDMAFDEIARVMKPGGSFVVLDHMAPAGAPATTGGDTHRIDKAIVIQMAEARGLTLVEESDLLANPEDVHTVNVFDPSVRRKTDRFLLKFTK